MDKAKVFRHFDYELQCGARPLDGGRFKPTLTVAKDRWPKRPREIDVPVGEHMSEADAIGAAYTRGIEWINEYGTVPDTGR